MKTLILSLALLLSAVVPSQVQATPPAGRFVNLSALITITDTATVGFVISGGAKTVLIRGVGPTLATYSVLHPAPSTTLVLFASQSILASNSGWSTAANAADINAAFASTYAFPLPQGSLDSAVLITLQPGAYTAQVSGRGAVLIEVYEVPGQ